MDNTDDAREGSQLIYGLRPIMEAVAAGRPLQKIFLQQGLQGPLYKQLEGVLRAHQQVPSYVPVQRLNRLTSENHQGAVALLSPIEFAEFQPLVDRLVSVERPALLLLLDQLTDVRNFGAILRSAECAGVDAVVVPKTGSAPINDDAVKTSAGAVFRIPVCKVEHLKDAIYYLKASGVRVVAATEKGDHSIYATDLSGPTALIMGAEGKGIHKSLLALADIQAHLPMMGEISSLNVSVACGVFLYEALRQRLKPAK